MATALTPAFAGGGWPDLQVPIRTPQHASNDFAVVIGVEAYTYLPTVTYAHRDADAFYQWLLFGRGLRSENITRLPDATRATADRAIQRAMDKIGPDGVLWIYFAGHGAASTVDGHHYLMARDDQPEQEALSIEALQAAVEQSAAAHVVLIVDAAFGGIARDGKPIAGNRRYVTPAPDDAADTRVVTWLAAGPRQVAGAMEATRQGLFTYFAIGALRGWADGVFGPRDGAVSLEEAQAWVNRTIEETGRNQTPSVDIRSGARSWIIGPVGQLTPELVGLALGVPPAYDLELEGDPTPPVPVEDKDATRKRARAGRSLLPVVRRGQDEGWEPEGVEMSDEAWLVWAEGELRKQVQAQADEDWSQTFAIAASGTPQGIDALQVFIGRYGSRSYYLQGAEIVISASQIPEARRLLLHGGRPSRTLVDTVRFEAGTFAVGSPAGSPGRSPDEVIHDVTLTRAFEVGVVEVSQRLWTTVMGYNPATHEGTDLPVETVTWFEAVAFCNALSTLEGYTPAYEIDGSRVTWNRKADGYRLPTEAEWVRVAGTKRFPGFDDPESACRTGNVRDESHPDGPGRDSGLGAFTCDDGFKATAPVRALRASVEGVRGLVGNVAEWTWDAWVEQTGAAQTDPAPDRPARTRVVKGGSFASSPRMVRTAAREAVTVSERRDDLGLRVVRTVF